MKNSPSRYSESRCEIFNEGGWECRVDFPKLWYDDIMLHGFHFRSQEEFFEIWEKRRKRYNPGNKLILKILFDDEDVQRFKELPEQRKLGFYYKETDDKNIITIYPRDLVERYAYQYGTFLDSITRNGEIFTYVDIFEILMGIG